MICVRPFCVRCSLLRDADAPLGGRTGRTLECRGSWGHRSSRDWTEVLPQAGMPRVPRMGDYPRVHEALVLSMFLWKGPIGPPLQERSWTPVGGQALRASRHTVPGARASVPWPGVLRSESLPWIWLARSRMPSSPQCPP